MKKILTSIVFGLAVLIAFPVSAKSWDSRSGVDHGGRQHSGSHGQYHNNYGNRYYHNNGNSYTSEQVVLAALLTGVIVNAAHRSKDKQPNVVYVSGYPQPANTCVTREFYDHLGRVLSTERTCY